MAKRKTCVACPVEVRDLYAVVSNYIGAVERNDDPCRVARKFLAMKQSCASVGAIVSKHFADGHDR